MLTKNDHYQSQINAAAQVLAVGFPEKLRGAQPKELLEVVSTDYNRREFLVQGLESWLREKYGETVPELKPIIEAFAALQGNFLSYQTVLSPETILPQEYKAHKGFHEKLRICYDSSGSRSIRNQGVVKFNGLHFRIGVLFIPLVTDAEKFMGVATCELDHKVWEFFRMLHPDMLYASPVQKEDEAETADEITRRFSRSQLPSELLKVLNIIELGNHDFTIHSLFDGVKEETKDRNSKFPTIDGKPIEPVYLSTEANRNGERGMANLYEILAFHLHAMAWKQVFEHHPNGHKIKQALLKQTHQLFNQLYGKPGTDDTENCTLAKALEKPEIRRSFSKVDCKNIVDYVAKLYVNFLANIMDPNDPELSQILHTFSIPIPASSKLQYIHQENLLDLINVNMATVLKSFKEKLEELKQYNEDLADATMVEELISLLLSDHPSIDASNKNNQLTLVKNLIEPELKKTRCEKLVRQMARIEFALGNPTQAIDILVEATYSNKQFAMTPIELMDVLFRAIWELDEPEKNIYGRIYIQRCLAVLLANVPKGGFTSVTAQLKTYFSLAGSCNSDDLMIPIHDAIMQNSSFSEEKKLSLTAEMFAWLPGLTTERVVLEMLTTLLERKATLRIDIKLTSLVV